MKICLFTISLINLLNSILSWADGPHMLVAKYALEKIKEKKPTEEKSIIFFINYLTKVMQPLSHGIDSFVQSATWADLSKDNYQLKFLETWHFKNNFLNIDDGELKLTKEKFSAEDFLANAFVSLTNWTDDQVGANLNEQFEKSFLLRYITHVIGDIHQPLHTCTRISKKIETYNESKGGDRGGNNVNVKITGSTKKGEVKPLKNMHKVLDYLFGTVEGDIKQYPYLPNDKKNLSEDLAYIKEQANNIKDQAKEPEFIKIDKVLEDKKGKWAEPIVKKWIDESTEFCKNVIWNTFKQNGDGAVDIDLNAKATTKVIQELSKRILLAGERLADVLILIWESYQLKLKKPGLQGTKRFNRSPAKSISKQQ